MQQQIFLLISLLVCCTFAFRQQFVGARGQLMCGDHPLNNTLVKLWNKNFGLDDQLAAVRTNGSGHFEVSGGVGSFWHMNVHLKIYHDCDDRFDVIPEIFPNRFIPALDTSIKKPCQRKVNLGLPKKYITRTSTVQKWFNAGVMNMEFEFPDEERSCLH